MFKDGHHILHNAKEWSLRPDAKRLRESQGLVPRLDRATHEQIHTSAPPVPLLGYYALQRILKEFEPSPNTLESVDSLLDAIDTAGRHPKAHYIERGMAELAIWAIELQVPFLIENEASQRRMIIDLGE